MNNHYWSSEINNTGRSNITKLDSWNKSIDRIWENKYPMRAWLVDLPINSIPEDCCVVKDKNVLDLGCGFVGATEHNHLSTSERFLDLGAKFVLGVDINPNHVNIISNKINDPNKFIGISKEIKTIEDVLNLVREYNINVIKSDIKGDERLFLDMPDDKFKTIDEYMIEVHNQELFFSMLNKLEKCSYTIREVLCYGSQGWDDFPERVRIIYAYKK